MSGKRGLSWLVGILAVAVTPAKSDAQVFDIIGKQYRDVSAVLADIGSKSVVYRSVDANAKQLYYVPFFALKADAQGSPDVRLGASPTPGRKQVLLTLLLSPQNKLEAVAAYIRAQEKLVALDPRYADVEAGQLIGIPLANLVVEEESPRIGFQRIDLPNYGAQGVLDLVADLPETQAKEVAEAIRSKSQFPQFTVRYDLSTRQELSQSELQASVRQLFKTNAVKDLLSAKSAGEQFGWQVNPDGLKLVQPHVTRSAREKFEGLLTDEARILMEVENEKDEQILRDQLQQDYFKKVFSKYPIDTDSNPLGRELARLNAYGLDPTDLKPDQIDKLVADVKNFFNQENLDKKSFEAGGSASFLGIGGSANVKTNTETLRKTMTDKGWKFESNGKHIVPKSFEVHILNQTALESSGTFSSAIIRRKRDFTKFNSRVSTSNVYMPLTAKDELVALEQVRSRVKVLDSQVPPGMMLPFFGTKVPDGFVLADGQTAWPDKPWVPQGLRGKRVPDLRGKLLGGATAPGVVGWVWDDEGAFLPQDVASVDKASKMGRAPRNPAYPTQDLLGGVSHSVGVRANAFTHPTGNMTYAAIPVHRHVMCQWIIRVE